jgi:transcriptional regulator with XRE-family HTH domain
VPKSTVNPLLRRLGQRIRAVRAEAGISQEALADEAGVDRSYMSGVERGVRNLSVLKLAAIARALGVRLQDLLTGD